MKLIVCRNCRETIALTRKVKRCRCRKTAGKYLEDGIKAQIAGPCTAFGINSRAIALWLRKTERGEYPEPYDPEGYVEAWAMPEFPENIERVDKL